MSVLPWAAATTLPGKKTTPPSFGIAPMGGGVYSGDAGAQDWEKHLAELLGGLALPPIGGVEA